MERELTVRQRRFALGVASGLSKTKAHAAAYPNNMQKATRQVAARRLAKRPGIKSEIERLTLQLLSPVEDMQAVYHHAFSTIVQLTLESADDRLRFDAARWLLAESERREQLAQRREKLVEKAAPERTETVIAQLRQLYAVAGLSPRDTETPLVVEVNAESESEAEESAEADVDPVEAESSADSHKNEPLFRREPVPGTFPQRFRKVPIR